VKRDWKSGYFKRVLVLALEEAMRAELEASAVRLARDDNDGCLWSSNI